MSASHPESILVASARISGLVSDEQMDYVLRVASYRMTQRGCNLAGAEFDRLIGEILVEQQIVTAYQAEQLAAGRTKLDLGGYLITDWIGQGGMGQVFKAVHQVMGRICAVKVLPLTRLTQESRENFLREIRMQAALDCPYLVRAYDAGQDRSVHYLVTEYVPGMDLRRLVKTSGPLPVQQAAKIVMHAARGIDYAHSKGMIHRDVKPGNILVTPEGDAKVSDVGLAGYAQELSDDPRSKKIIGTTDFLSPEQIRRPQEVGPASDIYSLGCTLYYAVCGKVPFPGGDAASKIRRHLEETPWHPRKFAADLSEDFVDIIADMMEKDATKRVNSAGEVAARLESWVGDSHLMSGAIMSRSPWMAPPPPSENSDRSDEVDEELARSHDSSATGKVTLRPNPVEEPNIPAIENLDQTNYAKVTSSSEHRQPGTVMVVALTLAIAIPPAILVGSIIGYMAAIWFGITGRGT